MTWQGWGISLYHQKPLILSLVYEHKTLIEMSQILGNNAPPVSSII